MKKKKKGKRKSLIVTVVGPIQQNFEPKKDEEKLHNETQNEYSHISKKLLKFQVSSSQRLSASANSKSAYCVVSLLFYTIFFSVVFHKWQPIFVLSNHLNLNCTSLYEWLPHLCFNCLEIKKAVTKKSHQSNI